MGNKPMADHSMTFSNTLAQLGGEDFLRELTEFMLNRIMEADVTARINAEPHERSDERETYRNGYRERQYNIRLGTLDLRIPKLREGSYFPSFLEVRRLSEKALNAVIQEAWINGISTRKVDALVQLMVMTGISRAARCRLSAAASMSACRPSCSGGWRENGSTCGWMQPT